MANLELPYYARATDGRAGESGSRTGSNAELPYYTRAKDGRAGERGTRTTGNLELPYYARANEAQAEEEAEPAPRRPSALTAAGSGRLATTMVVAPAKEGAGEGESWTMTYMDLVTLLLAFLVALAVLADFSVPSVREPGTDGQTQEQGLEESANGVQIVKNITSVLRSSEFKGNVDVDFDSGKITLQIREKMLFSPGSAGLSQDGADLLDMLVPVLLYDKTAISIEGHTDNVPTAPGQFSSNWDLSSARAIAVVQFLIGRRMDPGTLRAIGYADTVPVASNATAEGRAANRRVNLVIEPAGTF